MANINGNNEFSKVVSKLELLFPKISEAKAPLSLSGVSPRTYYHWRTNGIVGYGDPDKNLEGRVKLNLYDFVWLKMVVSLRRFGLRIKDIKQIRGKLFGDVLEQISEDQDKFFGAYTQIKGNSKETAEEAEMFRDALKHKDQVPEEYKILKTEIAGLINRVVLFNDDVSILIFENEKGYDYGMYSSLLQKDLGEYFKKWLELPHIHIALKPLISIFFDEPVNESNLEAWGFINEDEKKVLDAIRNKDYKEISIRFEGGEKKEMIIEATYDGDILEQKAKDVKRILGLNQYSEISIKYRNDKHLFFKSKIRL